MATLALSRELFRGYARLERQVRNRVEELITIFQTSTVTELGLQGGVNLERHTNQRDPRARTLRITDNLRGIVCDLGDNSHYVLHEILTHADAEAWMRRKEFRANKKTGALEIIDFDLVEDIIADTSEGTSDAGSLFAHRADKDFRQLGINPELIPALRAFTSDDQLQALFAALPEGQANALILLTGDETTEAIFAEIAGSFEPDSIKEDDLAAALDTPASKVMYRVVADEKELRDMMARPLALWRTFLHHSQHGIAYRPTFNGPARVTGGPGTGKTVVAMHRAKYLASHLGDRTGKPILFTTYTTNLAKAIERDLRELGGAEILDVVEVTNIDKVANRIVREADGSQPGVIHGRDLNDLWATVAEELGTGLSPEFLANEWEQVVLAHECRSRDEYFRVSRTGRGVPLDRRGRAKVWAAVEAMNHRLIENKRRTFFQLADDATGHVARRTIRPYQHVIVDEAQDLHEAQWRLIRSLVDESPNDLFIVGDSHQRIYDRRTSLSKVGINIVGRSRKLRINYRTTHEILRWALAILGEATYDDLDEGMESHDFSSYHSFLHGPYPTVSGHDTRRAEFEELVSRLTGWIDAGIREDDIVVTARTSPSFDAIEARLTEAGIPSTQLGQELPSGQGVRISTMHRLKGTEFRCVAVLDVDDDTVPLAVELTDPNADKVQHSIDLMREQCLLYVACTRAREDLWVGWSGTPSRFLGSVVADT